jgi:osmotically-inducible protein OsmY
MADNMSATEGVRTMLKTTASLLIAAVLAAGAAGCTSTEEKGGAESAGATAGRVVDDSVVTGKVKAALVADPVTKAHQINVETFQGTVQLSGFVDSNEAKSRASEIARTTEGVKDVKNSLQIRDTTG